jgi:Fur family transcriptional regulator, ferric uptake regulator
VTHEATVDVEEVHRAVGDLLRQDDQLYTRGRRNLVERLARVGRPMTLPEVLEAGDDLRQSSVYRNLAVLEQLGAVVRINTGGEHARYELAEDILGHHHHLICVECGRVDDVVVPASLERSIDRSLEKVVAEQGSGFVPSAHRLDLMGTCSDCV